MRGFTPHLTIAKTGLLLRRGGGLKHIDKKLYEAYTDSTIGSQKVSGLELLSMVRPLDSDGYYHCFGRCDFDGKVDEPSSGHVETPGLDSVSVEKSVEGNLIETECSGNAGHDICTSVVDSENMEIKWKCASGFILFVDKYYTLVCCIYVSWVLFTFYINIGFMPLKHKIIMLG